MDRTCLLRRTTTTVLTHDEISNNYNDERPISKISFRHKMNFLLEVAGQPYYVQRIVIKGQNEILGRDDRGV